MPAPLVTVVVLNFNGERILAACLDRLLAQTYPRLELIVVDNHSTDGSANVLSSYEARHGVTVIRSPENRGCPGGRNLGLAAAAGEIVAFMDNDGYASPQWLERAVEILAGDDAIGAVASLVFFNRHKLILNGAGGTLNWRGYGGDYCFKEPYEFAGIPQHVLYPMGCGMVVRRAVLDRMGGFDESLFNYYDDAEVGFWAWRMGLQVVCAPEAWVDHDFGASDAINRNKLFLCERNRIRTVLKYFPASLVPGWLGRELLSLLRPRSPSLWAIPYRAWAWNLAHLRGAMRIRHRYRPAPPAVESLLQRGWGTFPPPRPNNHLNRPDPSRAGPALGFDGEQEAPQLNFGWYQFERHGAALIRWTSGVASAFLRAPARTRRLSISWLAACPGQLATLRLRRLGETEPIWQADGVPMARWDEQRYPCAIPAGTYELHIATSPVHVDRGGRELGVAVSRVVLG